MGDPGGLHGRSRCGLPWDGEFVRTQGPAQARHRASSSHSRIRLTPSGNAAQGAVLRPGEVRRNGFGLEVADYLRLEGP